MATKCPVCGAHNNKDLIKCEYCGVELGVKGNSKLINKIQKFLTVVFFIAIFVVLIYLIQNYGKSGQNNAYTSKYEYSQRSPNTHTLYFVPERLNPIILY